MSNEVASLKATGDSAFKAGNLEEAIQAYTQAIDKANDTDTSTDVLKALYSNRSASYALSKNFNSSLLDAEKCIELDSTWVKGIIRKGDALFSLRRYNDALKAYKSGLELSPGESSLKGKVEQVERAINVASQPPPPSSSYANMINSPMLDKVQGYLRMGLFVTVFGSFMPFIGRWLNSTCYKIFIINAILSFLISLYLRHGFPRFSQDYLQRIMMDQPTSAYLFMSILLLSQKPYILSILPIVLVESFDLAKQQLPALFTQPVLEPQLAKLDQQMPAFMGRPDWSRLSTATKWSIGLEKVRLIAATCEVWQGIFFIVELALPSRSLIGLALWWQYLQMRCMLSAASGPGSPIMRAFAELDAKISGLVGHQYCPGAIKKGYNFIRQQAIRRVQIPEAGASQPSMMDSVRSMMPSSCNIS